MTMRKRTTVKLAYKGILPDGTVYDQATPDNPLEMQAGMGFALDGFEREIMEMELGEKKTFTVKDYDAFGEYIEEWVDHIPKDMVPGVERLKPGKVLWTLDENGAKVPGTVIEINDDYVVYDCNHPLAGNDITFEVEILEVDESTAMTEKEIQLEEAKRKHYAAGGMLGESGLGQTGSSSTSQGYM